MGEGGRERGQEVGVGKQAEDDREEDDLQGGAKKGGGVDGDKGPQEKGGEEGSHYPCSKGGDGCHADAEGDICVGEKGDKVRGGAAWTATCSVVCEVRKGRRKDKGKEKTSTNSKRSAFRMAPGKTHTNQRGRPQLPNVGEDERAATSTKLQLALSKIVRTILGLPPVYYHLSERNRPRKGSSP